MVISTSTSWCACTHPCQEVITGFYSVQVQQIAVVQHCSIQINAGTLFGGQLTVLIALCWVVQSQVSHFAAHIIGSEALDFPEVALLAVNIFNPMQSLSPMKAMRDKTEIVH